MPVGRAPRRASQAEVRGPAAELDDVQAGDILGRALSSVSGTPKMPQVISSRPRTPARFHVARRIDLVPGARLRATWSGKSDLAVARCYPALGRGTNRSDNAVSNEAFRLAGTVKARISDAGRDLGIGAEAGCGNMYTSTVPLLPPRGTLLKGLSSAARFRFRNDVLGSGSDLGKAHDSASRLPEVTFDGVHRENRVK